MIENIFYNVLFFGSIISLFLIPLLFFLTKNKYKYKLKNVYKIYMAIVLLLMLLITGIDFYSIKEIIKKDATFNNNVQNKIVQNEIILEKPEIIIEVNESINIKNNFLSDIYHVLPKIWITITILLLAYNLFMYINFLSREKKYFCKVYNKEIDFIISNICNILGLNKVDYKFSDSITTPMVVGLFKKTIILPSDITSIENYDMVLKHEIVHIKNKDIECKFLLLFLRIVYWFNPIIYKFVEQIDEVLELRCDEIVLENQSQEYKIKYAQVLLNQIEFNRKQRYVFSMNFANKRGNIMRRFSNIVDKTKKKNVIGISCVTAGIIIVSSAIIFSIPSINFAVFKENGLEEIEDNTILETTKEETVENIIEDNITDNTSIVENTTVEEKSIDNNEIAKNSIVEEKNNTTESEPVLEETNSNNIDTNTVQNTPALPENAELIVKKEVVAIPGLIFPLGDINEVIAGFSGTYKHTGIDFKADEGTGIKACASGTVLYSAYKGSYGNLVIIDHGNDTQTYYAHCSDLYVSQGQTVNQGDIIAAVGSTGNSTGPHLHLELRINRMAVNPIPYLK